MRKTLIAIGGNSLIRAGERGTIEEQPTNVHATARSIIQLVDQGWNVVLTHGNGYLLSKFKKLWEGVSKGRILYDRE